MIAEDKFGRTIYSRVFAKLKSNEKVLLRLGYAESNDEKPNLFSKTISEGRLYADMRATEEVPLWEDTRPLFYWFFGKGVPNWKRRRVIKQELIKLADSDCPCRLSLLYTSLF